MAEQRLQRLAIHNTIVSATVAAVHIYQLQMLSAAIAKDSHTHNNKSDMVYRSKS